MCELCDAGDVGKLWTKELHLGKKNVHEAALFFKTGQNEVLDHINNHDEPDEPEEEDSSDFYIRELKRLFKLQKDWIEYCIQSRDLQRQDIETLIKLSKETRETIRSIGEFEGRLNKQPQVSVNIAIINKQYDQMKRIFETELCEECKVRVIDQMDLIAETTSIT
jgi:endonuclease III-like uncharacterized protein